MEGQGTYYYNNGNKYVGQWKNDKREGQGTMTYSDCVYTGPWQNDVRNGYGVLDLNNGDKYSGNFVNDKKDGYGVYVWKNGIKYEGNWSNNNRTGKGKLTYSDATYDGDWVDNKRDGYGTTEYNNGNSHIGYYKNDTFDGFGIFNWKNGERYQGYYKNGVREGQGTYTWPNGDKYVGEWAGNNQNGEGIYYFASGATKKGIWKDGKCISEQSSNSSNYSNKNSYSSEDYDVDFYIAQTKSLTSLYDETSSNKKVVSTIPKGEYVFLSTSDEGNTYRKVIYVDKDQSGYVLASQLINFSKVEEDESGKLTVKSTTYKKTADIEIYNNSDVTATISIGKKSFKFSPHEKRTIEDLTPGTFKIVASSPGVIPYVGKKTIQAGHIYSWEFFIYTDYN